MDNSNTAELVRNEIEKDIFIQHNLSNGLINHSALAREFLPTIKKKNKKATLESVTVAIARYQLNKKDVSEKYLEKHIANSQILLRNDIIHATFNRDNTISSSINETAKKIRWDLDEVLFINQGSGEITIIFDKKNEKLFNELLKEAIEIRSDSAIISIIEAVIEDIPAGIEIPGLYSYFISQVSKNGINLLEIISTRSQITFVINEKDLTKSYNIINDCIKHFREKLKFTKTLK